jgi:hypothetical protein
MASTAFPCNDGELYPTPRRAFLPGVEEKGKVGTYTAGEEVPADLAALEGLAGDSSLGSRTGLRLEDD